MQDMYVDNMASLGFGTPLYEPDPGEGHCAPQIGDLGYLHRCGRFISIFNIFSGKMATSKSERPGAKVGLPDTPAIVDVPGVPAHRNWNKLRDNIRPLDEDGIYVGETPVEFCTKDRCCAIR